MDTFNYGIYARDPREAGDDISLERSGKAYTIVWSIRHDEGIDRHWWNLIRSDPGALYITFFGT